MMSKTFLVGTIENIGFPSIIRVGPRDSIINNFRKGTIVCSVGCTGVLEEAFENLHRDLISPFTRNIIDSHIMMNNVAYWRKRDILLNASNKNIIGNELP